MQRIDYVNQKNNFNDNNANDDSDKQNIVQVSASHQSRLIRTTQAWKQTLPPSDQTLCYTPASV